jgi:hypothetical protein
VIQVVEQLPSKHEPLSSNPSTAPFKKTKRKYKWEANDAGNRINEGKTGICLIRDSDGIIEGKNSIWRWTNSAMKEEMESKEMSI